MSAGMTPSPMHAPWLATHTGREPSGGMPGVAADDGDNGVGSRPKGAVDHAASAACPFFGEPVNTRH